MFAIVDPVMANQYALHGSKLGRLVQGFHEQVWAAARFDLVVEGNVAKFSQHPELGTYLIGSAVMEARSRLG
jgi:predicted NAD-dependent protein-ADP-ribosyltransferase YbiA (DUF1768 family)